MATPPYRTAPNVFEQFSKLGEKVGSIPTETAAAFFRGKELAETSEIRGKQEERDAEASDIRGEQEKRTAERHPLEKEKLDLENQKLQAELDRAKAEGKNNKRSRDLIIGMVRDELGEKFTPNVEKNWREGLETAKDWEEMDGMFNNFLVDHASKLEQTSKAGKGVMGVDLSPQMYRVTGSGQYGADRRTRKFEDFKREDMRKKLEIYDGKFGDKGNQEAAIKFVGGDELGFETVQNKEVRALIKDEYESISKSRDRASREKQARSRGGRAEKSDALKIQQLNEDTSQSIRGDIEKAEKKAEKAVGAEYKALISTGKYLDPKATAKYTKTQRKDLKEAGDLVKELEEKLKIPQLASEAGEFLNRPNVDALYKDAKDGEFSGDLAKKYGPKLGYEETVEEEGGAGEYTAEQESLIAEYMGAYEGYTREQIIQSMITDGVL